MFTRSRSLAPSIAWCEDAPSNSDGSREPSSASRGGARGFRRRHLPRQEWTYEDSDATSASTFPSRAFMRPARQP
jgi:hypothetical protein